MSIHLDAIAYRNRTDYRLRRLERMMLHHVYDVKFSDHSEEYNVNIFSGEEVRQFYIDLEDIRQEIVKNT